MDSTLLKGLNVLELLARSASPRGASELARETGLTRSNVHRTLQTLVVAGFARSAGDGRYECTLKLFELASAVVERVDIRRLAGAHMQRLASATQETVHLSALDGAEVVYLDKIESPLPVRAYSTVGGRAPAHCVASGKALLAQLSEDELDRVIGDGLHGWTDLTITDPGALRREMRETRDRGYSVNRGEWRSTVAGVAAAVFNAMGKPEGSVGVSGPADRILPKVDNVYRDLVLTAARDISRELGCPKYPVDSP